MSRRSTTAIGLLLLLGTACARGTAVPSGASTPPSEAVAPQTVGWSPVKIAVVPAKVKPGSTFEVRLTVVPGGDPDGTWTATDVWLDRQFDGKWQTLWFLDDRGLDGLGQSLAYPFKKPVTVSDEGHAPTVPLKFTLNPPPPPGEYRLRLHVFGPTPDGPEASAGPTPAYWSVTTIEVLSTA